MFDDSFPESSNAFYATLALEGAIEFNPYFSTV